MYGWAYWGEEVLGKERRTLNDCLSESQQDAPLAADANFTTRFDERSFGLGLTPTGLLSFECPCIGRVPPPNQMW